MAAHNKNPYDIITSELKSMETNEVGYGIAAAPPPAVIQQPAFTTLGGVANGPHSVGPDPVEMTCPHCRCRIRTKIRHRATAKTHIACILLSWTLCCCCLPYCMDTCRNTNHFCPMCGAFIGSYDS